MVPPPFYNKEKGVGKVKTPVPILAAAFLYAYEWRCMSGRLILLISMAITSLEGEKVCEMRIVEYVTTDFKMFKSAV
jgi:hypothetical protein